MSPWLISFNVFRISAASGSERPFHIRALVGTPLATARGTVSVAVLSAYHLDRKEPSHETASPQPPECSHLRIRFDSRFVITVGQRAIRIANRRDGRRRDARRDHRQRAEGAQRGIRLPRNGE